MSKVAVVLETGFEELEALTVVDVMRRAGIAIDIVGVDEVVTGAHKIEVIADKILDDHLGDYEMLVLPGGLPGATNLRDNPIVINALKKVAEKGGYTTAICAAPIVLDKAGLLEGKDFTNFPGFEEQIHSGTHHEALVVVDGKVITSRGPAAALEFAYTLVEQLGVDPSDVAEAMQYDKLFELKA